MMKEYKWAPMEKDGLRWVGVDWDETIVENTGFPDFIPTHPIKGAVKSLQKLDEMGYKVIIFTARPWSDYQNIESYCIEHDIPARRIICGKPLFKCIIDDKNVAFNGNWEKALVDVLFLE